jgi:predicted phage-related endonuclease
MKIEKHPIKDRASWLAMRLFDITASDVSAVTGCNPYKSAAGVWAEKAGLVEPSENNAMRAGRWLEHAALAAFKERHPTWDVVQPNTYYRSPEHRLGATPDAIAYDPKHSGLINVEFKSVGASVFKKWDEPPLGYQLQCAAQAMLMDARYSILAVLTRSEWECELHEFKIPRNARAEARVLELVADFFRSVESGETPAVDHTRDLALITKIRPPKEELEGIVIANDNRWPSIIEEHEELKAEEKSITQRIEELRCEIIAKLNGAPLGVCGDWRIKHKIVERHLKPREACVQRFPQLTIMRVSND